MRSHVSCAVSVVYFKHSGALPYPAPALWTAAPAPPYSSRRRVLPRPAAVAVAALPRPAAAAVAALPRPAAAAVAALPRPAAAAVAALPRLAAAVAEIPATVAAPPCRCSDPAVAAVVRLPFPPLGRPRESLTPQQLREWYASWGCRGGRSGIRPGVGSSGASGSDQVQLQRRPREALSPQQLREWYAQSRGSLSPAHCPYVMRTGVRTGQPCGTVGHTGSRCFACLSDPWRTKFGDAAELPDWVELLRQRVDIFALDYDAILTAMYALSTTAEGACHVYLPPDPGIQSAALGAGEAAALGTGESTAPGAAAPAAVLNTFTLDSSASRSFFRDSTTLTPLSRPVAVSLADPSGGPVLAHSSMVLPCPAAPSGLLMGLHLPSFSTNLVSGADLQDTWVDQFTPGGQRVTHCTCSRTGRHLATFTRRPGSSLYTLTTAPPPVYASGQVAASSQVFAPRPGLVLRLPPARVVLWRTRLSFGATALGTPPCLVFEVWPPVLLSLDSPARARGQGHERYFLLVVDDYSRYTTVFPLRSKGEVPELLIDWIRGARRQLSESFGSDLPVLHLHSDRGGEFSSDLLRAFCRSEGIRQTFTLPASPQQNGIAERRIGMYAALQINLQPRVSLPKTTHILRWTGKVGDASAFRVWGSRAFVRDTTADKLSSCAVPCVFLGFPPDAPEWQFYHPTSRRVLSSQDVTCDESVSYYRLFPYRTASPPPPPLFLAPDPAEPVEVAVASGAARGADHAGAGTGGAETGGAESGGAETGRAEPGGVVPEGSVSGGAEPARAESGGALGVPSRREPLSPQRLREWYSRRCRVAAGAGTARASGGAAGAGTTGATGGAAAAGASGGAGAAGGATGAGATGGTAGARATGGTAGAGAAGGASGAGAAGGATGATGGASAAVGGAGAGAAGGAGGATGASGGAGAAGGGAGAGAARGAASAGAAGGAAGTGELGTEGTDSVSAPASPLPCPSPYSGPTRDLTERREPESRPMSPASRSASPVRTVRAGRVLRPRLPPVPGTHSMTLRPSTAPQRVPLPSPPASSLPVGPDPKSYSLRAASPTVTRFLATAVTDPLFESFAASALVAELVDFPAACRLDYATSLVAESASAPVCPPSVGGECALGTDVLEDRQEEFECFAASVPHLVSMLLAPEGDPDALDIPNPRSYAEAIEGPYSSQWQVAMDAEMASWKSTGTYVDEVPPPGANIVSGMWIFRVKRPPGSPPAFKARYVARGFSQWQGVDFFQTFSPTPKMTTLRGSLHEEIWLRHPPGFTGSFPAGTQWSLRRPVYGLRQAPREWHDTLMTTLASLGFAPFTADPSLFLHTDTTLPSFYVLVYVDDLVFANADTEALAHVKSELQKRHTCTDLGPSALRLCVLLATVHSSAYRSSLSAPPLDESVEPSGLYPELVGCLITSGMGLVLGGRARVVLTGHADASWVDDLATQRSSQGYTFSLGSGSVSWLSTRSSSVLSSSCEAEIYAGAMAAQELRWLTYLLTDLGEAPRSPPVLYVDNKAMLALCQEHRLEHRTKHIALRYFLAQELQQRGQLRLAYVASQANTADVFTKALQPCDHQHFCTV
ncbi:unnamed protein product [Closterium sp. NIES-53]